jgi:hypothetical protein
VSSASITYGSGTAGKFLTNYGSSKYWSSIPVTSESTTTLLGTVYGKTSGSNYAIGQDLYPNLSTGTSNIAIGGASMYAIQGGNGNVAIGESAFAGLANMNYNVGIGLNVMFNAGANGGGNNVAIGANAGSAATGTVDNNVLIGSSAGGGVGVTGAMISGTNNILIGYQSIPSATNVSNEITLGDADVTRFRIPGIGIDIGKSSTLSSNSISTIDTTVLADFTSIEYMVSLKQGTKVRTSKVIVQNNGSSVDMTEFAITETGGVISGVAVSAAVSSTNAVLQLTVTDAASTNVTVKLSKVAL